MRNLRRHGRKVHSAPAKDLPADTSIDGDFSIRTERGTYLYDDILDHCRGERAANGGYMRDLSRREVSELIEVQIGEYAILDDPKGDAFIVGRIDDEGLCEPIKADLRIEEAEDLLNELAKDAEPIWSPGV